MAEFKTVQELLAVPERWTKGVYARKDNNLVGGDVEPEDPTAVCWCLIGAILCVYPDQKQQEDAIRRLNRHMLSTEFENAADAWNDHPDRTHQEVLDLVMRAGL